MAISLCKDPDLETELEEKRDKAENAQEEAEGQRKDINSDGSTSDDSRTWMG